MTLEPPRAERQPARATTVSEPTAGFQRTEVLALVGITLVAILLRLFKISEWSLWVDEVHTLRDATMEEETFWKTNVSKYPVSATVIRNLLDWGILQSTGEGWLRLPFAFFGILTIPAVALFGRSVVGSRPALLASAFLAVHPWHIYWSQNVRGYAITCFFATCAAFLAHRALRWRSLGLLALSILCVGISGMAHPSGFLLLPAMAVFAGLEIYRDTELRERIVRPASIAVFSIMSIGLAAWFVPAFFFAANEKPDASVVHLVQTIVWFATPALVIACLAGILSAKAPGQDRETSFLMSWLVVPTILLLVLGALFIKATARFELFIAPAICLVAAKLCFRLHWLMPGRERRAFASRWALPAILVVSFLSYDALYFTQQYGDRPRWREAAQIVRSEGGGRAIVLTHHQPSMEYYLDRDVFWAGRNRAFKRTHLVDGVTDWKFNESGENGEMGGGEQYLRNWAETAIEEDRKLFVVISQPELDAYDLGTREGTNQHTQAPYRHESGEFDRAVRRYGRQIAWLSNDIGPRDLTLFVWEIELPLPDLEAPAEDEPR
ncbi:MAG: glycosyltransferase family 39 protein [Planctomycetota bacterium]